MYPEMPWQARYSRDLAEKHYPSQEQIIKELRELREDELQEVDEFLFNCDKK